MIAQERLIELVRSRHNLLPGKKVGAAAFAAASTVLFLDPSWACAFVGLSGALVGIALGKISPKPVKHDAPIDAMSAEKRDIALKLQATISLAVDDMTRLSDILSKTAEKIYTDFNELTSHSVRQREKSNAIVNTALHGGSGESGAKNLLVDTVAVMQDLVDGTITSSKHAMSLVYIMDDVASHVNQNFHKLNDIDKIVTQTGMISINASIEAARVGEMGRGFSVVAEAVRSLSDKTKIFAEDIKSGMSEIKNLVEKAEKILTELASHDMTVSMTRKMRAENALVDIQKTNELISSDASEIDAISEEIESAVNEAVMSLQFHDIATQLIATLSKRMEELRRLAEDMQT